MLPIEELRDFSKYANDLRIEIVKSKTKIVPFRYLFDFDFAEGKRDILLVGKFPPKILKEVKNACGTIKAEGECRLVDGEIRLKVEGGKLNMTRVKKMFTQAKIKFTPEEVESFQAGVRDAQTEKEAVIMGQRLGKITTRAHHLKKQGESSALLEKTMKILTQARTIITAKGGDHTGVRLEEMLDYADKNIITLEKNMQLKNKAEGKSGPKVDAKFEESKDVVDRELADLEKILAVSKRKIEAGQTALTEMLSARKSAMIWQEREMQLAKVAAPKLKPLETKYRADEKEYRQKIKNAEAALILLQTEEDRLNGEMNAPGVSSKNKKRLMKAYQAAQKLRKTGEVQVVKEKKSYTDLEKKFSSDASPFRAGNKHGTGRHGAHTGIEQQAMRSATGGISADQDENEWGLSGPESVAWKGLKIVWTTDGDGNRTIQNENDVLQRVRKAKTSTSSNFLSPELEKEAVERALKVARQCVWDEEYDSQRKEWKPLDLFFVRVGPPTKNRAKGWGHRVSRQGEKVTLENAIKVLERFRSGKIDQNKMLKELNVALDASEDGGAILSPVARVMVERSGGKWINTSQYPTNEQPGWSLDSKTVRKSSEGGEGVNAPSVTGV